MYEDARRKGLIPDEEAYLVCLGQYNMNTPDHVVLKVSGLRDDEMIRLYCWARRRMEGNYVLSLLLENPFLRFYWKRLGRFLSKEVARIPLAKKIYREVRRSFLKR
jgi:hypothetical protein